MRHKMFWPLFGIIACSQSPSPTQSRLDCTSAGLTAPGQTMFLKSYDWMERQALLMTNARNVRRDPLVGGLHGWTSDFGSLSFSQAGIGHANGGINEVGFMVEVMVASVLPEGQPHFPPGRYALNELQYPQYLLDRAESIEDAIRLTKDIRIQRFGITLHYFACAADGACAALEYNNGWFIHDSRTDPDFVRAFSNDTFEAARENNAKEVQIVSAAQEDFADADDRVGFGFQRLSEINRMRPNGEPASPGGFRKGIWQIAYVDSGTTYFRIRADDGYFSRTAMVDLQKFDLSCTVPQKVFEIERILSSSVLSSDRRDISGQFENFSNSKHDSLIDRSGVIRDRSPDAIALLKAYPRKMRCLGATEGPP